MKRKNKKLTLIEDRKASSSQLLSKEHTYISRGGRNRIGRREKWPKQSWEEGEMGGKSREEGEKEK